MFTIASAIVILISSLQSFAAVLPIPIPNNAAPRQYIISLKTGLNDAQVQNQLDWAVAIHKRSLDGGSTGGVGRVFNIGSFHAYAGSFDDSTIVQIASGESVASIEPNHVVTIDDAVSTQEAAPWGLASLSSNNRLPEAAGGYEYSFDGSSGGGTFAYILDTGVQVSHPDFGGRAVRGINAQHSEEFEDLNGHGTHVAGIVGSQTYGVVKKATIVDVKVMNQHGSGNVLTVLDGFKWAIENITNTPERKNKSIISMSLGFYASTQTSALDSAINAAYDDLGVVTIVSAGNGNEEASRKSPARAERAVTVAAADRARSRAAFSNHGTAVKIFAPGVDIGSVDRNNGNSTRSGSSQATPHVAGLLSYLISKEKLETPIAAWDRLKELGLRDVVADVKGATNLLAYNGNGHQG
ncbi:Alkaline protease 1 [Colletotrichum sidae]|uniref:Alkaline protease 1 n=1 Tax=Colletotrichum sidae TaxID=1347389 RepID=A0A4R8T3U5_9PEZI|nr:Alkaline protease 1 [Colletotrichum sidae]